MAKKKTRSQKIKTSQRRSSASTTSSGGFKVSFGTMSGTKISPKLAAKSENELKYFRIDLTKVLVLTMLALASEIVLWLILKH